MKILILSCNTGQGHNSVANALSEIFEANGDSCEILDALAFISDRTARFLSWGHSYMYCHFPRLFEVGYDAAERHKIALEDGSAAYRFITKGACALYEYCIKGQFDAILCTHVFSGLMLTEAKKLPGLTALTYFVATDYTCSPGALDSSLYAYFIPDASLAPEFGSKNLIPAGIPVRQEFFSAVPKAEAKRILGIPESAVHILMMCGSMGCGPMEELTDLLLKRLPTDCQLSIICGTNQRLNKKLAELTANCDHIHVHGFVDQVPLFMDSADLYITKPGGISTTEAMIKNLPMVLVDAVAGCEDYNMQYFTECGGAVAAKDPETIAMLCLELIENEARRRIMSGCLSSRKTNAAQTIYSYVRKDVNQNA